MDSSDNDSSSSTQHSLVQLPVAMDSNNDSQPSADMDSNNDSILSPQQSLASFTKTEGNVSDLVPDLAQLQAYDNEFLSVLASFIWTEGKEGWPPKPFEIKECYFEKSLSLAKKVSNEFYRLAATEVKILSNEKGDFKDYKICVANNWVRGKILCLRKLLEDHLNISEYRICHGNIFEDLVEELLMQNKYCTETLFTCWTHWKNNIVLALRSLSAYQAGDPNEHVKFAVNYLGIQRVNGTWYLLFPKLSWMKQETAHFVTAHGTRLFSINLKGIDIYATLYWKLELASVGFRVFEILRDFYASDDNTIPPAHRFSTVLHICDVVKFLQAIDMLSYSKRVRLQNYTNLLIEAYLQQISPLGWNAEMTKDIVILRKSCVGIVEHFICLKLNDGNDLNYGQLTDILVMIFGAPKLDDKVYRNISLLLQNKKPWEAFINSLMRQSDTKEGDEANQLMLFYGALENTISLSSINRVRDISPTNLLYLLDRLLLWTSLLKDGVIYATKSTMTEWLIQHDKESIKRLNCMIDQTNLERVHEYLSNLLLEFSKQNSILTVEIAHRIFAAACMLHLSSRNHFSLLRAMLSNGNLTYYLEPDFWRRLAKGRTNNHIGVQVVARALQCIKNPLVIATLRHGSLDIVCLSKDKDEIKVANPVNFWNWLENLNKVDNSIMKSFLKPWIVLVTTSLQNPLSLESQDEMRELMNLLDEMKELLDAMSLTSNDLIELSKRILSRKSKVAHILNQLFLINQSDAVAEWEAQGSSVAAASSQ